MDVNFAQELKTLDGESISNGRGRQTTTLKDVTIDALLATFQDEQGLPGNEKLERYKLALRVSLAPVQTLNAEEISLIKKLIGKAFSPLIVGQAYLMLEGGK